MEFWVMVGSRCPQTGKNLEEKTSLTEMAPESMWRLKPGDSGTCSTVLDQFWDAVLFYASLCEPVS